VEVIEEDVDAVEDEALAPVPSVRRASTESEHAMNMQNGVRPSKASAGRLMPGMRP
jgi:hypothetical protein